MKAVACQGSRLEVIDLPEATECCGFGGTFAIKNADTSMAMLGDKVRTVLDIRLNNTSQLAGFAKKQDLPYFLDRLCNAAYVEMPELAPSRA